MNTITGAGATTIAGRCDWRGSNVLYQKGLLKGVRTEVRRGHGPAMFAGPSQELAALPLEVAPRNVVQH